MKRILILCLLLSEMGCRGRGTDEASEFFVPPDFKTVDFQILSSQVIDKFCIVCHKEFKNESSVLNFVVPGSPERSIFYQDIESGRMPQNGPRLSSFYLKLVATYIRQKEVVPTPTPVPLAPSWVSLQPHLFKTSCVGCHGIDSPDPGRRIHLSERDVVVKNADDILRRIQLLDGEDEVMPPPGKGRPKPTGSVAETFKKWIELGYPEN